MTGTLHLALLLLAGGASGQFYGGYGSYGGLGGYGAMGGHPALGGFNGFGGGYNGYPRGLGLGYERQVPFRRFGSGYSGFPGLTGYSPGVGGLYSGGAFGGTGGFGGTSGVGGISGAGGSYPGRSGYGGYGGSRYGIKFGSFGKVRRAGFGFSSPSSSSNAFESLYPGLTDGSVAASSMSHQYMSPSSSSFYGNRGLGGSGFPSSDSSKYEVDLSNYNLRFG